MSIIISKETISRLVKDVKQIMKNPLTDNGIYYIHSETDVLKGYALIIGPSETPYYGGYYFFELNYPSDYPHSPPKATYWTNGNNIRFNPNLYKCGKVCVSLLNTWRGDQWTSCQTISSVLLTICTLLCDNPLLNEPGVTPYNRDFKNYTDIIEFANIDIAICDILNKKKGIYVDFFDKFYPQMIDNYLTHYDNIVSMIENRRIKCPEPFVINTYFYHMNVEIDYNQLLEKYKMCKSTIESYQNANANTETNPNTNANANTSTSTMK